MKLTDHYHEELYNLKCLDEAKVPKGVAFENRLITTMIAECPR